MAAADVNPLITGTGIKSTRNPEQKRGGGEKGKGEGGRGREGRGRKRRGRGRGGKGEGEGRERGEKELIKVLYSPKTLS